MDFKYVCLIPLLKKNAAMSENIMSENGQGWVAPGTSSLDIYSHTTQLYPSSTPLDIRSLGVEDKALRVILAVSFK